MEEKAVVEDAQATAQPEAVHTISYITGWRLRLMTLSITLSIFVVNIEVSIVTTSLVSIVNGLGGFNQMGWVVTGYLITYTSFMIVWTKSSNAFGRKTCILATLFIFTAFSGGCGAAQSMTQLVICRAFQGIGAAGCVSLGLAICYEMVPLSEYPKYGAIVSAVNALGSLLGPIIGGAFSQKASWRWSFLFNVPLGVTIGVLLFIGVPNGFPHQEDWKASSDGQPPKLWEEIKRLDLVGAFFMLGASLLLVTALLGAGVSFSWDSPASICLFLFSGLLWICFVLQEFRLSKISTRRDPVFPWEFFKNRAWMGTLLISMLGGAPYIVTMVDIPQRFQTISNMSALDTGLRLIPFNLLIAVGAVVTNIVAGRTKIPPIFLLFFGTILQITGISLMATMDNPNNIPTAIYGYQVVAGFGIGIFFGLTVTLPPVVTNSKDFALCAGAVLQFRIFGGALALAVASAVMNNYATTRLEHLISPDQLDLVLKTTEAMSQLPSDIQSHAVEILVQSYNQRMKVLIGFTAAQIIPLAMMWKQPQIAFPSAKGNKKEAAVPINANK